MHSFRSLPYDRSTAPFKASSPQREIYCFLVQFPVSSHFLEVEFSIMFWSQNTFYPSKYSQYDRSTASFKASSPQREIYCFLVQFPVSSRFLEVEFSIVFWSRNTFYPSKYSQNTYICFLVPPVSYKKEPTQRDLLVTI